VQELLDIVQDWYNDKEEGSFSYDNRMFYLLELFQILKKAGMQEKYLKEVGNKIVYLLDDDFIDESIHMIFQRRLAHEVKYAFRYVNKEIKEIKDDFEDFQVVRQVEDGDIYPNNTDEPDIDLRGVDLGDIVEDREFLKKLGINNE
jgi:hypothetical protein